MREQSDRQLWAWIAGEEAAERLAGIPLSRIERLGDRDLLALRGVGRKGARSVRAVAELARRFAAVAPQPGTHLASSRDVARLYRRRLGHEEREVCYVLALDVRLRLTREELVSVGGLYSTAVHPRDVFAPVVRERAASAIVVHNHPSGNAAPSGEDLQLAVRLKRAADVLGVRLLDFVVVGRQGFTSLCDTGLLLDDDDPACHRVVRYRRYQHSRSA